MCFVELMRTFFYSLAMRTVCFLMRKSNVCVKYASFRYF
jgi:hypothetical protein